MSTDFETFADIAAELRHLGATAEPSVTMAPNTARTVLQRAHRRQVRNRLVTGSLGVVVAGALAAGSLIGQSRYFEFVEPSEAMSPTVAVGDVVTLDKNLSPVVGDVVLVRFEAGGQPVTALFRYAADSTHSVAEWEAWADCAGCSEVFVAASGAAIPAGRAYLLGDNRLLARDSRMIGTLPKSSILGVAISVRTPGGEERAIPGSARKSDMASAQVDPPDAPQPAMAITPAPPPNPAQP